MWNKIKNSKVWLFLALVIGALLAAFSQRGSVFRPKSRTSDLNEAEKRLAKDRAQQRQQEATEINRMVDDINKPKPPQKAPDTMKELEDEYKKL